MFQESSKTGNQLSLYRSLFKGREDVFAIHWQKGNKNVKHYRQLRYLASKHDGATLKLRFVLNPFSFVFLLTGTEQYHVVLETLDTEEATYIWHIDKSRQVLSQTLRAIDHDLNVIRNKGRQFFLNNQPENFSRLLHDYSDERKGFVVWKDMVEERLI